MWHLIGQSIGTHLSLCFYLLDCWLHIESFWYHYPWCMFGYCIHLRHWYVDYINWSFCLSSHIDSHCCMITLLIPTCIFLVLFIFFILISWFFLLYTILITSEHAIILVIYSSWFSYSWLACAWTWMIYLCFAWLSIAWLLFFYVITCCLSVWAAHLSPYLQPSSCNHFLHFGSHFFKCEALCVLVPLTELDVRSRV